MAPHVLVVDDSATVRVDLRTHLVAAGFTVTTCETKGKARRALKEERFALAILDVILPDGNGVDLLREIRMDPDLRRTPVILLSSQEAVVDIVRSQGVSADWYVGKPYDSQGLIRRVQQLIAARTGAAGPGAAVTGKRVLVVDDCSTFLTLATRLLQHDGHTVLAARSGDEALQALAKDSVDHIFVDLQMPGMDGIETCRRIKRAAGQLGVPVTLMSASEAPWGHGQPPADADDFVLKAPALTSLRARLRGGPVSRWAAPADDQAPLSSREGAPSNREGALSSRDAPLSVREAPPSSRETPPSSRVPVSDPPSSSGLFDRVIAASGLSSSAGRGAIARACRLAGVSPDRMNGADLARALPLIREALAAVHTPAEVARRMNVISALARLSGSSSTR